MSLTKGRISRTGIIKFHDAKLMVWEEGIGEARNSGGLKGAEAWERQFKHDVFARVVQTLNRIGWSVMPWKDADAYKAIALNHRTCSKGDLQAELSVSGRCIELEMWQDVQNVENSNGGKYDFDKERRMTYLQRLEMERTRRKIRDYLCNVFTGYTFEQPKADRKTGATALEIIKQRYSESWHFKGDLTKYTIRESNQRAADGGTINHGAKVWFADYHGRIMAGTAFYNGNNMWWVVTGKYGLHNQAAFEIYTHQPESLRIKRNGKRRLERLKQEMTLAIEVLNFERAAVLRDVLQNDEQRKAA